MKWKTTLFILFLLFLLLFLPKAYADITVVQTVNNFDLLFLEGSSIGFQHLTIPNIVNAFNVNLTVTSGTLNGTNGYLRMFYASGILRFTSQNTTTLRGTGSENVRMRYNGALYYGGNINLVNGDSFVFEWGTSGTDYIGLTMGLLGIAIIIVTPAFTAYQVKRKKDYMWLVYCLVIMMLGVTFLTSWLIGA